MMMREIEAHVRDQNVAAKYQWPGYDSSNHVLSRRTL